MKFQRRKLLRDVPLLPTLVTLGNAVCGFLAILKISEGIKEGNVHSYEMAAWFILLAMFFDALDGRVARMTRAATKFGSQLDSLCDLVSFGIAPAFLVYALCGKPPSLFEERVVTIAACFYASCAIIRLARFTVETPAEEKYHLVFSGLPTPASAGIIAASVIPWTKINDNQISRAFIEFLPLCLIVLGFLMISRIKYVHLVNRFLNSPMPFIYLVVLILFALFLALLHEFAIFSAFVLYALMGPLLWLKNRLVKKKPEQAQVAVQEQDEPLF